MQDRTEERPARPGETCTCGHPATIVYLTTEHGAVPYCGQQHTATPCTHELCAADHHDTTPDSAHHHRVVTDEHDAHRVVAYWTGGDLATGRVELTHHEVTVTLTPREAEFWSRTITGGNIWLPARGGGVGAIAVDLATAAEVLLLLDGDVAPPDFGSRYISRAVADAIDAMFDEDEEATR